jgi:D-glycero-D-manno-heptose 1,7-bisphosphate phosphatase
MAGVALLDRDGTINVKAPEGEYITTPDELELLPGAARAIRLLNDAGVPVAVVTNQRGIALGRMTEEDLRAVHDRLSALLRDDGGARVDLWLHCPHEKDACSCRKPQPGMLVEALERLGGDAATSLMAGDAPSDVEAGAAAGVPTERVSAERPLLAVVEEWLSPAGA